MLELDQLLLKHEAVFRRKLGTMQGVQAHLKVDPTAQPKFHKPCSVPYALKGAIEQDLERLERIGVIERFNTVIGLHLSFRFRNQMVRYASAGTIK